MRKFFAVILVMMLVVPAAAEDAFVKQISIGRDGSGMTWYLTDYGIDNNTYYAVARKYYTSAAVKNDTIERLISRNRVPEKKANTLYLTEYRYEYTSDGKQYAEIYRVHYDMQGREIYRIDFDNSTSARRKHYINVVKNSIMSKGYAYASGRLKK